MNGFDLSTISELYVGSTPYSAIYKGSNLIWQAGIDYSKEYFTIESLEDNNTISFGNTNMDVRTISWSTDKTTWNNVTSIQNDTVTIATINTGDKLYFKATNNNYGAMWGKYNNFKSIGQFNVYGNTMSLLYGDNFIGKTSFPSGSAEFYFLFYSSKVVDASNLILPATNLSGRSVCYSHMFNGCSSLVSAPALPATTLGYQCYNSMFTQCTSLTAAPVLPATHLDMYSYGGMFNGCTSLNYVEVYAEDLGTYDAGFNDWLLNVSSTGTFKKSANMTSFPSGASGIPSGWTVIDV